MFIISAFSSYDFRITKHIITITSLIMFSISSSLFRPFKVYKNYTPPPSSLEFVENYFRKSKNQLRTNKHNPFLARQPKPKKSKASARNNNNDNQKPSIYSIDCGGVYLSSMNNGSILDESKNEELYRNSNSSLSSSLVDADEDPLGDDDDSSSVLLQESKTNNKKKKNQSTSSKPMLPRNEETLSPISRTAEGYSVWENLLNINHEGLINTSRNMNNNKNDTNNNSTSPKKKPHHQNQNHNNATSSWSHTRCGRIIPPFEIFEGNAKEQWIDGEKGFCHLCQTAIGGSLNHIGERDHCALVAYLYWFSVYPRTWDVRKIVLDALQRFPKVGYNAVSTPFSSEHLHTLDDTQRRLELESILVHLSNPDSPNFVLENVLQGNASISLWVAGERIFKPNLTQLVSEMCLPMTAGVQTGVTQKCWSRTNLERMYDALNIAKIQESFGAEPKVDRLPKAFFMRTLFFELHNALDETRGDEYKDMYAGQTKKMMNSSINRDNNESELEEGEIVVSQENSTCDDNNLLLQENEEDSLSKSLLMTPPVLPDNHAYDYHDATKKLLVQECLRRLAFELVYLNTMHYMNQVQYISRTLKHPTLRDLHLWDSL